MELDGLMELNERLIDFNKRMVDIQINSGMPAFKGYLEAFNMMLDGRQWYLLAYHDDPKNPGKRLLSDRMAGLTLEEAHLGMQDMLQGMEDDKQIEDQLNELL